MMLLPMLPILVFNVFLLSNLPDDFVTPDHCSIQDMELICDLHQQSTARATCPCSGIVLNGADNQQHCWQIESRMESTWSDADESCVNVGGHIGHPDDSVFAAVLGYVQNVSSLPVLTGIVSGSGSDSGDYAMMCQSNSVYNKTLNSTGLFDNNPNNLTTCAFMSNTSSELVFFDCSTNANVLCDRPLESEDYCSIKANCSSTTTLFSTTTESASTSNTSLTSTTGSTQSNSSLTTGGTFSSKTTSGLAATGSTTKGSGSGSDKTCTCTDGTTIAPTSGGSGSCSQPTGCLKHQWKIFGMCVDWRAMLALIAIGLGLFLCCCICHFCMHACMFCTPAAKRDRIHKFSIFIVRDPILHNTSVIAPVPLPLPKKVDYDIEKSDMVILPPAAIQPEPVIITVPEKHESVYGFHTKEIIHVMPDRPSTREIGTMTDPMDVSAPIIPVGPVIKRKKVVKKPKKMFIPANLDPMDSIEEDIAAEIPIDIPQSPDARSIAPLGDFADPVPPAPLNFMRNPKPMMPDGKTPELGPRRGGEGSPPAALGAGKPNNRDNDEFDPRGLRSPPPPAGRNNDASGGAPRRMTFSPIADDSDEDAGARIPSPPRERKAPGPKTDSGLGAAPSPPADSEKSANRPILKNKRLNEMASPTPGSGNSGPPAKSPTSSGGGGRAPPSSNPFASLGGSSPAPEAAAGGGQGDDVGMRAARGKLGGAVRGGGGGGEAPSGWKPWAKGGARR